MLNFFLNLIISNLAAIKLICIKFTSVIFSSATTTNPNNIFLRLCLLGIWDLQYWDKWCSYPTKSLDETPIKVGKFKENLDVLYWLGIKPLLGCYDSFILHTDIFWGYHIAEEPNFFLINRHFPRLAYSENFFYCSITYHMPAIWPSLSLLV